MADEAAGLVDGDGHDGDCLVPRNAPGSFDHATDQKAEIRGNVAAATVTGAALEPDHPALELAKRIQCKGSSLNALLPTSKTNTARGVEITRLVCRHSYMQSAQGQSITFDCRRVRADSQNQFHQDKKHHRRCRHS